MKSLKFLGLTVMVGSMLALAACGGGESARGTKRKEMKLKRVVNIHNYKEKSHLTGSSTVYPIMEAAAEEYNAEQPDVKVAVKASGTGGGMGKFQNGETDFTNASHPMKDEEAQAAKDKGVDFKEFQLAYDGLSVVVNKDNDWVDQLTIDELKKMWINDGSAKKWSDINPDWPKEEIAFFSPGHDSGTYDYWNEVILEDEEMTKASLSEDDNVLVTGVTGDKNAISYFGYAYYLANKDNLKVVPIVNPETNEAVEPNNDTIESGDYAPLSRPLFTYVNTARVSEKPEVYDFLKFVLENASTLAEDVGYVSLPQEKYDESSILEGLK